MGLFGSLGTWPLLVQILNSLHIPTCFYLQPFQLSPRRYCWEQGRRRPKQRLSRRRTHIFSSLLCLIEVRTARYPVGNGICAKAKQEIGESSCLCFSQLLFGLAAVAVPSRSMPSLAHSFISWAMEAVLGGMTPVVSGVFLAVHCQGGQMSSPSAVQQSWPGYSQLHPLGHLRGKMHS